MTQEDVQERFMHKYREALIGLNRANALYEDIVDEKHTVLGLVQERLEAEGVKGQGNRAAKAYIAEEYIDWRGRKRNAKIAIGPAEADLRCAEKE